MINIINLKYSSLVVFLEVLSLSNEQNIVWRPPINDGLRAQVTGRYIKPIPSYTVSPATNLKEGLHENLNHTFLNKLDTLLMCRRPCCIIV